VTPHVDPRELSEARGADRLEMVTHVAGCAACRDAVIDHDPALLFALLAIAPIPGRILEEVSTAVAPRPEASRPRLKVAAAAVIAGLALASGYLTLGQRPRLAARSVATDLPTTASAASLARADVEVEPAGGVSHVVDLTVGETQVVMVYNGDLDL